MVVNTLDLRKRLVASFVASGRKLSSVETPRSGLPMAPTSTILTTGLWPGPPWKPFFRPAGQPHFYEELAAQGLFAHKVRKVYVEAWGGGNTWSTRLPQIDTQSCRVAQTCEPDGRMGPGTDAQAVGGRGGQRQGNGLRRNVRVITLVSDERFCQVSAV